MRKYFSVFLLVLVTSVLSTNEKFNLFPNLPVGPFKFYPRAIIQCRQISHVFEFNFYLNKISINTSEVRGNSTFKKPWDDSYDMTLNMAVKDSIGGWKDNAFVYRISKACTTFEKYFGDMISTFNFNMSTNNTNINRKCPYSAGVYVSNGFDLTNFISNANIPKQFFYGNYRARIEVLDKKNKQSACIIVVAEIKRPWEAE